MDPSLIDDVGLSVLDESHMIGPSERSEWGKLVASAKARTLKSGLM